MSSTLRAPTLRSCGLDKSSRPLPSPDGATKGKLAELRRFVEAVPAGGGETLWLDVIFRVRALLDPGGELGDEIERLFQAVCKLKNPDLHGAFVKILARGREELLADLARPSGRARQPLHKTVLQQDYLADDEPPAEAMAMSLYMPLDLLAHHEVTPGLRELLSLPLRLPSAADVDAAIARASAEFPSLRLSSKRLDFSSHLAFAKSFNAEMQSQTLVPGAAPARKKTGSNREPDWDAMVGVIVDGARRAIAAWRKKHGSAYAFVLEVDPPAGYVLFSVETAANHVAVRRGTEREAAKSRRVLDGANGWREAKHLLSPRLDDLFNPGDFAEQDFDRVDFGEDLHRFSDSELCPVSAPDSEDYVSAKMRLCLWRAIENLVAAHAFAPITDTPIAVGYCFHEESPVILHIVER
jgi:hypothetical protein